MERNFIIRTQAMDDIEFHVIDRIQSLKENADSFAQLNELIQYAENVKNLLSEVNTRMFQKLREQISRGNYRGQALKNLLKEYLEQQQVHQWYKTGYDDVDLFLNGLLTYRELPVEIREREPGMIYYQKTPARIVFELIKKAAFQSWDVFYDLGSGLGQVTMMVNLLTSVLSKGVEFEPAYCKYAKSIAADLNLRDVDFINADARYADYSSGTIFFMYTPFEGEILKNVLQKLYAGAKKRKIRIFTFGSCTTYMTHLDWLRKVNEIQNASIELAEFVSV